MKLWKTIQKKKKEQQKMNSPLSSNALQHTP